MSKEDSTRCTHGYKGGVYCRLCLAKKKEMEEIKREKKEWYKKGFAKQNKGRIRKW